MMDARGKPAHDECTGYSVIPGHRESDEPGIQKLLRDSGFDAVHRPGMTF
jgi:hypothetical protein